MEVDLESAVLGRRVLRRGGRREWFRVARRELEADRARQAQPIPRDREDRLFQALGRLEENHRVDLAANEAYERWRATARDTKGRVLKGNSKPYAPPELPEGAINLSDPDSRVMRTQGTPPRQAYNAQTAVNEQQIILAAEISLRRPGLRAPRADARSARSRQLRGTAIDRDARRRCSADAGYWHTRRCRRSQQQGIEVLVPPDGTMREGKRPGWEDGLYEQMRDKLDHRARPQALRAAEDHDRAGLRADQIQPAHRPVHAKRQSRRAVGVAVSGSDPQPAQAPQPLDRQHRLTRGSDHRRR